MGPMTEDPSGFLPSFPWNIVTARFLTILLELIYEVLISAVQQSG